MNNTPQVWWKGARWRKPARWWKGARWQQSPPSRNSARSQNSARWWQSTRVIVGAFILIVLLVVGLDPHLVTHYSPWQQDSFHLSDYEAPPFPPSRLHWFGTDEYGTDLFTQIVYGIVPTFRDATILVVITLFASIAIAVLQAMYKKNLYIFDRLTDVTKLFPPVLLMLLILEMKPIYFSHYSSYWYFAIIGLFEIGRLEPIVEGDIRLIYQKPFIESAITSGGSQLWIFRKHVWRWITPYVLEYIPSQYARILTVMGELGYFGVVTKAMIFATQSGEHFMTHQLDLPTLLASGGHHWFTVPGGVFFPTIALCLMIVSFRLIATGVASTTKLKRGEHWPWPEYVVKLVAHRRPSATGFSA
jgi:ABC-type dipeptide/oligopeptide/nickel transport system permease subunit